MWYNFPAMRHPPQLRSLGALAAAFLACRLLRWLLHPAGIFRVALGVRLCRLRAIPVVRLASLSALASLALAAVLFSVPAEQARAHTSTAGYHGESFPLHAAVRDGVLASVSHFIDEHEENIVNQANAWRETPLHLASNGATAGHVTIAATLIAAGANVNAADFNDETPLHFAAEDGHASIVSLLIAATASLDLKNDGEGRTPLYLSARNGHVFVVSMLIAAKASLDVQDKYGDTPLHQAANYGRVSIANMLIAAGANLDVKNNGGDTPLYWAVFSNEVSIASALIAAGADVHAGQTAGFLWTPLLLAASKGRASIADMLIAAGATLDVRDRDNNTPLHLSAVGGHSAVVSLLLAKTASVGVKNDDGDTPLHLAAANGRAAAVAALLAGGADVNAKNNDDKTPLHLAVDGGHAAVVAALIAAGGHWGEVCAAPAVVNLAGPSPPCVSVEVCKGLGQFYDAALSTCVPVAVCDSSLSEVLYAGVNDCHVPFGLHAAAEAGDLDIVNHFITVHRANVNGRKPSNGFTPLHVAAYSGHVSVAAALLAAGANVSLKTNGGATPLHRAVEAGHPSVVALLISADADVNAAFGSNASRTPLAFSESHSESNAEVFALIVDLLIAAGGHWGEAACESGEIVNPAGPIPPCLCEPPTVGTAGNCVAPSKESCGGLDPEQFYDAAADACVPVVECAPRKVLYPEANDCHAASSHPLHAAVLAGDLDLVNHFITVHMADVNARDDDDTPLHYAANGGHAAIASVLIAAGADVNAKNDDDDTPLRWAAGADYVTVVVLLLAAGADVDGRNEDDETPLHWAARNGRAAAVDALIAGGADVDAKDKDGDTPLHFAARNDRAAIVSLLVQATASLNVKNEDGKAPLHLAAEVGYPAVVSALIAEGADVNARDKDDKGPLHLADAGGHADIVAALIEAGAYWGDAACGSGDVTNSEGPSPACAACAAPSVAGARTNLCDCSAPHVGMDGAAAPGNCACPAGQPVLYLGVCVASCPDGWMLESGKCVPSPAVKSAIDAALLAEVQKPSPNLATVRFLLDQGASRNITTSAGIPILVAAATLRHAEVVSVLITAGADVSVTMRIFSDVIGAPGGKFQFLPALLAQHAFYPVSRPSSPADQRLAEVFFHFGNAAGDRFDWQKTLDDNSSGAGEIALEYVANRHMFNTRQGGANLEQNPFLERIGWYILGRGAVCQSDTLGIDISNSPVCASRPMCPATVEGTHSCSECPGYPLYSAREGECVSQCKRHDEVADGTTWPDGQCVGIPPATVSLASATLAAEIEKTSPFLSVVRAALEAGANPNITVNGRPALIEAGRGGHAKIVSVLVTAGANVNARDTRDNPYSGSRDFALHAAGRLSVPGFPALRATRASLLYHFGDALDVRNAIFGDAKFNWNFTLGGHAMLDGIADAVVFDTGFHGQDDLNILKEMADYAILRGAMCAHSSSTSGSQAARDICNGSAEVQRQVAQAAARVSLLAEVEKAADAASVATVRALLDEEGVHPNVEDSSGRSLLLLAARNGHAEIVSVLITAGADVNATDSTFRNFGAVHHAASPLGDADIGGAAGPRSLRASVLYYFGGGLDVRNAAFGDADFDWKRADINGRRLLDLLALAEDTNPRPAGEDTDIIYAMADYALARGSNCGDATADRTRRVCAGAPRGANARALLVAEVNKAPGAADASVALALLDEEGAHPNVEDSAGRSLLILAARNGHAEIVSVLITAGADVSATDPVFRNFGAVHYAAAPRSGANAGGAAGPRGLRASVLYYFGGGLDVRNAASSGNAAFDWNREDAKGFRPLDLLADSQGEAADAAERTLLQEMADYLIAQGGECGVKTADHSQLVCRGTLGALLDEAEKSAGAADVAVFLDLLENVGADPDYADSAGRPLLIVAARNGHAELVSVLAAAGANVNATDRTFFNRDVAHHAASTLSVPAVIPRGLRASVLYHFGGGLEVRNAASGGAKFNWNREDAGGNRALDLLADAEDLSPRPAGEDVSVIYQMADYMLLRGANCGGKTADKTRRVCAGSARIMGARTSLLDEVKKPFGAANVSVVLDLLDSGDVFPDIADSEGTPILIVAATLGHAEIVSVLITAGANPEARLRSSICGGSSIGRAVPHVTAQNNFGSSLHYTWGTALNVLRHFADAVNQVGAPYDWNSNGVAPNCFNASRAIDYLRFRYDNSGASLPEEESIDAKRAAIGRMADILIFNGSSCEREANVNHVTCAGAARMSLVAEVSKPRDAADAADAAAVADLLESEVVSPDVEDSEGTPILIVAATLGHAEIVSVLVTAGADPDARLRASICGGGSIGRAVPHLTAQNNFGSSLYYPWETALTVLRHFAGAVNQVGARYDWNSHGVDLDCATESRALDFLRPRYDEDDASLPEESVDDKRAAMGRMAGVLIANGASCENQANKDHVTCAGPPSVVTVEYGANPPDQSGGTLTASVLSGGTTPYGARLTFTAIPENGWEFSAWQGDAAACPSSDLECVVAANGDLRVTALFSPAPSVRYAAEPSIGGSVTVAGTDGVANDVAFVYSGGTATFTAIPANGWEFLDWQGDAAACPSSDLECAVEANGNLWVTARFSTAPSVRYAAEPSSGGTVTITGTDGVANSVAFVYSGGTATFTAIPENGWEFLDWQGDAAACPSSDLECAVEANGNLWVTARFSTAPSVRYAAEPSSGGTVTITGTDGVANSVAFVYSGGTATFTAIPENGWELLAWEGDAACPPFDWECAVEASGNLWVTARFSPAPRARHAFEPSSGGTVTITGTDGVANSVAFVYSGRTATFTAIPENGWEVSVWAGDAAACPSSDWECAIEAEANNDLWVTARFSPAPRVRHASEPSSGGTVTITGTDGVANSVAFVYSGGTVTFKAVPADGWGRFAWLGDCAGAVGDSCALMATQDVSVGATFRDINECAISEDNCAAEEDGGRCANTEGGFACSCVSGYSGDGVACHADKTVSFLPSAHGTLSAEGAKGGGIEDGETTRHGTTITFTANPDPGYQVSVWLGACAGTAATVAYCKATATVHVSAGATFKDINECEANTDNCAAEADGGLCTNTDGGFTCGCLPGYSGKEQVCRANKTISFLPSAHGTLSAEGAGMSIQDGGAAAHGTTITFTANPDPGYQVSVWLGACAGTAATVAYCKAAATVHVSAGAAFKDINECEANTDNCAAEADGGLCTNTDGGFTCGCLPGYSGKEQVCRANKTISFLPSAHGTLSAEGAGISIQDGGAAAHGTTVTFTAKPDPGYQVSVWLGACAGTAATVASCKATATVHVSAGATFKDINECEANTDNCAAEADGGVCTNTDGGFTCGCLPGYSGDGVACRADKTVSFLPSAHGTLSAEGAKGGGIEDGETTRHGTTITFTANPDPGYQVSVWLGACAGTAATVASCKATATVHVSAGATFKDINECEANTDNCAAEADGGVCTNTDGGFTCGCLPGYSGKEQVCRANKTISFLPSAHGTLSAEGAGISIQDGGAAAHGTTITFTAKPDPGYQVSVWLGVCAGTAATVTSCKATATVHVSAGATFKDINECEANTDNCAAEADGGVCTNTDGGFTCGCLPGYSGKEQVCRANKTISFQPPAHGTLFAESAGVTLRNGDTAAHGTTITFTAAPDAAYQLSMWTGDCDGTSIDASAGSFSCEAAATVDVSVGATFVYTGRCAVSGHLLFGAPRDLRCAPPTICPANYIADNDCLPASTETGSNSPRLPDAANEPNACARVFGGRMRTAGGGQTVCSNIDRNDTFCIVGSRAAFPCRGLFKHVWTCNTDNRPALNPFFCGKRCAGGANMARGRECGQQTLDALQSADDIADPQKH